MSIYSLRLKIENLNSIELAETLTFNGYPECYDFITKENITGQKLLQLSEFHIKRYVRYMPLQEIKRLYNFISKVKEDPRCFQFKSKNYEPNKKNSHFTNSTSSATNSHTNLPSPPLASLSRTSKTTKSKILQEKRQLPQKPLPPEPKFSNIRSNSINKNNLPKPPVTLPQPTYPILNNEVEAEYENFEECKSPEKTPKPLKYLLDNIPPPNYDEEETEYQNFEQQKRIVQHDLSKPLSEILKEQLKALNKPDSSSESFDSFDNSDDDKDFGIIQPNNAISNEENEEVMYGNAPYINPKPLPERSNEQNFTYRNKNFRQNEDTKYNERSNLGEQNQDSNFRLIEERGGDSATVYDIPPEKSLNEKFSEIKIEENVPVLKPKLRLQEKPIPHPKLMVNLPQTLPRANSKTKEDDGNGNTIRDRKKSIGHLFNNIIKKPEKQSSNGNQSAQNEIAATLRNKTRDLPENKKLEEVLQKNLKLVNLSERSKYNEPILPLRPIDKPQIPLPSLEPEAEYIDLDESQEKNHSNLPPKPQIIKKQIPLPIPPTEEDDYLPPTLPINKGRKLPPLPNSHQENIQDSPHFRNWPPAECRNTLNSKPVGAFVLRSSKKTFGTLVTKGRLKVYNVSIKKEYEDFYLDGQPDIKFKVLSDLLNYYMKNNLKMNGEGFCLQLITIRT